MKKHYEKEASSSSTQPNNSEKQILSNMNEHELINVAEYKAKYTDPTAKGMLTTYYANEQEIDRFIRTHQLYCFFTRKLL